MMNTVPGNDHGWSAASYRHIPVRSLTSGAARALQLLRAGIAALAATVVVLTVALVVPSSAAAAAEPPVEMTAEQLNEMFRVYGDAGGHWTGGDSTVSVKLPDGRIVWLFSDTFLGTVAPDGTRPSNSPMVHNTMVVQDGTTLVETLHGGSAAWPQALVRPEQVGQFFWVADGLVEANELRVLYNRYERYGGEVLDIDLVGTSLATFALPELTLTSVVDLPVGTAVTWGAALLATDAYTYVYGTSSGLASFKFMHLARAAAGALGGEWEYWDGAGWSDEESDAVRIMSGVGNAFAVQQVGSQFVLATHQSNFVFDPQFVAYTATSPTGPFTGPMHLLTAPEHEPGTGKIAYVARLHTDLARPGKLLMSYDVNSLDTEDVYEDARLYRPRFVEFDWPLPQPDPASVPAAPTGLQVTTDSDGFAHLSWQEVDGAANYRIYQRNVTNGQSHFARRWQNVDQPSTMIGGLVTANQYQFKVTAENDFGEGSFSATVGATPRVDNDASIIRLENTPEAVEGSYMIRFKDTPAVRGTGVEAFAEDLVAQVGAGPVERLFPHTLRGFAVTLTEAQAIDLAGHPDVLDVEQDQYITIEGEQQDPPWGLDRIDQRELPLDELYRYPNTGSGVRIYVVDSGIRLSHQTFGGRATAGVNTIDPYHGQGHNTDVEDCHGHGTHVAGIAGGSQYGTAKDVELIGVKVFDCAGESTSTSIADGIEWSFNHYQSEAEEDGRPPAVMNLSLSVPSNPSLGHTNTAAATLAVIDAGITVVAAAGNQWRDACRRSPAFLPEVITVGNADMTDTRHPSSNYGQCVDLFAPGTDILSAGIASDTATLTSIGTSMATPHVSGAAAMVLAAHPSAAPSEVKQLILAAATTDVVSNPGTGSPNLLLFVEQPLTAAPTNLTATAQADGTIELSWDRVDGENIHYLISQRDVTAGDDEFTRRSERVTSGTEASITGLVSGHTYEFTVAAANSTSVGPESNVASATAQIAPPPAPTNLTATANDDGTIALQWQSPSPESELWFQVYQRDVTAGEAEFTKLPLPVTSCCTMTAGYLSHDHVYEYQVAAMNQSGEGERSNVAQATSAYPLPEAPSGLQVTAGDGEAVLTWTASPSPNVWYWVYQRDVTAGETEFTQLPLPIANCCTMTAGYLTNGHTYEFKVTAIAAGGESTATSVVQATPRPPVPGQVTGLTATPNADGTIRLQWTAPAGGPYWYDVYMRDVTAGEANFTKLPLPALCCSMTAGYLAHNHIYQFRLVATNGREGPTSSTVQATAAQSMPTAPTNLRATSAGDGHIDLTWSAPWSGNFYYWIYYRNVTLGESSFTKVGYPTANTWASLGPFVHNHLYEFRVTAENLAGEGPASNTVQVTSRGGLPLPPSNLTATAGNGQVSLQWSASPTPDVMYIIYQRNRTTGGSWQKLPLPTTATSMTAGYLANGHTYEFRVTAANASGDSAASNTVAATPMPPTPQPPTNLNASAGDGRVTLTWSASSTSNVYYWIEYRANGGAWQRGIYPVTTCCSHTVSYLLNGTKYDFRLRSTNLAGDSSPSNVATATPMPPFPQAPSGLTATAGDGRVTLRWTASSTPNVYYWIEYRPSGGTWQRLAFPVTTCCTHTVSYLQNRVTHEFRVRATNPAGVSAASNVATARPAEPGGCSANARRPVWIGHNHWGGVDYFRGTADISCYGWVGDVSVSVALYLYSSGSWSRVDGNSASWGSRPNGVSGTISAQGGVFATCSTWMTVASVSWTGADGIRRATTPTSPVLYYCRS